ncbi:unnamed protein product [Cunninghamella blakesleeana]
MILLKYSCFFLLSSLIHITFCIDLQKFLRINQPQHNQPVTFDYIVPLDYHLIKPTEDHHEIGESIDITFQWNKINSTTSESTTNVPLEIKVHQRDTKRKVGWDLDQFSSEWKTPACPFFIRYPPHQYQFSLIFQPKNLTLDTNMIIPLDFKAINITGLNCESHYALLRKNHSDTSTSQHHHSDKNKHKADNPNNTTSTITVNHH